MSLRVSSPAPCTSLAFSARNLESRSSTSSQSARRILFGPPSDVDSFLSTELNRIKEEGRRRWNFDFTAHSPVNGPLQWDALALRDVPAAYHPTDISPPRPEPQPKRDLEQNSCSVRDCCQRLSATPPCAIISSSPPAAEHKTSPPAAEPKNKKRRQTITDYYSVKKTRCCSAPPRASLAPPP